MAGMDGTSVDSDLRGASLDGAHESVVQSSTARRSTTSGTTRRYARSSITKCKRGKQPLRQPDISTRNKEMEYQGAWAGYVAGLRWFAVHAGMSLDDASLVEWRSRGIEVKQLSPRMQGPEPLAWPERSDCGENDVEWAQRHLWSRSPSAQPAGLPLLVPPMYRANPWRQGPAERGRYATLLEVLGYWVETARAGRVDISVGAGGLGMWCAKKTYASRAEPYVLARAHFGSLVADISTGLVIDTVHGPRGMVLGPAGMANAGCRDHCNADFRVRGGVLELHAGCVGRETAIEVGEQILINQRPPAGAMWYCPTCEKRID